MSPGRIPGRWRRLGMGLLTVTGLARRGWFIPHARAGAIPPAAARAGYPALTPLFAAAEPAMRTLLDAAAAHRDVFDGFREAAPPRPRWEQSWYPRLDGLAAYTLVRAGAPARILEIGSGHSTRFLAAAVADGGLATEISAVDPAPRAGIAGLPGVRPVRAMVQDLEPADMAALAPGDVLAVDSSHILMPGSDIDRLIGAVLPRIPAGVLVCVHDIFLPAPYPAAWAWRGYNEQAAIAALLAGGGWRILWASHYAARHMAATVAASVAGDLPLPDGAPESALWLEKTGPPVAET